MPAFPIIYQTQLGPMQPLAVPIASATIDLTTITSPTLQIVRPDGTTVTWTATVQAGATARTATLLYTFVSGDLTTGARTWLGIWRVAPFAVSSANPVEFDPYAFQLVDQWGRRQ